jgi:sugar/nucleoside kinase (ribokinase family)
MSTTPPVLCAGIIVADHVCTPISHVPSAGELVMADDMIVTIGGCASNVAVDLAKMGVRSLVAGRVGDDAFGRIVRSMLEEHRIDTSRIQVSPTRPTSQTMIINVKGQDRRFVHIFGANSDFTAADIPMDQIAGARVIYLGGYLLMPGLRQDDLATVLRCAREAGVATVVDVAIPFPGEYVSRLDKLLPHVDVFLPNNAEGELILGEKDPLRQALEFRRMGAGTAVITMGGEGALLVSENVRLRAGTYPITYVDGSGGGDAFDAGYIAGMLRGLDAEGCLRLAAALGASCVRAIGTTPGVFTVGECEEFMRQNTLRVERL